MALIKCGECGTECSSEAAACPKCAHPISGRLPQAGQEKKKGIGKIAILGCAGLAGLCLVFGVIGSIMKPPTTGKGARANTGNGPPAAPPQAIQVSPSQLVQAYDGNEIAADQSYKGKMLRVTGTVESIRKDLMDNIFVTLESGHVMRKVQVFFDDSYAGKIAQLSKGTRITVRGECGGLMMNVLINDAVLE